MKLLVVIINDRSKLTALLDRYYELGIKGATVIDSQGMGHLIADHVPFFTRFAELNDQKESASNTIFSVIKDDSLLNDAIEAVEEVVGDLNESNTGVLFVLPIEYAKGCPIEKDCPTD